MKHVCVFGAGVIGLSTAVNIQEVLSDVQVTIVADKFNHETLSNGAAGLFRPHAIKGSPELVRQWLKDSFSWYTNLADSSESCKAYVYRTSGYMFSNKNKDWIENPLCEEMLPLFNTANSEELKMYCGPWKYGVFFATVMVECRKYLPWLMERFLNKGGIVKNWEVSAFKEFIGHYDVVVNCAGINSNVLVKDQKIQPIRGQLLRVHAPWIKQFVFVDGETYIIPGVDSVVLGGTRQLGRWDTETSISDSQGVLERCTKVIPSLKYAKVIEEWAGLRPYRDPLRLETEIMQFDGTKLKVVHNYGHGGNGVSLSWGCGRFAAKLVNDLLQTPVSKI